MMDNYTQMQIWHEELPEAQNRDAFSWIADTKTKKLRPRPETHEE